jgi:PAS domain S-box-containing protein
MWETIKQGKEWRGEFCNLKKNGDLYWEAASISPVRDEGGNITHFVAVKEDITQRKMDEEALRRMRDELEKRVAERTEELSAAVSRLRREIEEREQIQVRLQEAEVNYRTIADFTYDWELWIDPDGTFRYASPSCRRITGYPAEDFLQDPGLFSRIVEPDDRKVWEEHCRRAHGERGSGEVQFRIRTKGGGVRWIEHVCQPVRGEQGEFLGIRASNRDITAPKQAEEALRRSESSLAEAQRISHLGNWDLDLRANSLSWSDEIYRIFGLQPREFGATYEAFLNSVHPDDLEHVKGAVNRALQASEPYSIDHRIVLPDGTVRVVHEQAEVLCDASGQAIRMVGTVQDITERKQIEKEREERLRFEQLLSELSAMFVNIPIKQIDAEIKGGLQKTGEFLGVERVTLLEFTEGVSTLKPVASFTASGFEPYRSSDFPHSMPWIVAQVGKGEQVVLNRILDDLPPEASTDKAYLQNIGLRSKVLIPIKVGGKVEFAISLSSFRRERRWPDELVKRMRLLGEIFVNILIRKRATIKARSLGEELAHVARVTTLGELAGALAHEINQPLAAILSNAQAARRFLTAGEPDMEELAEILKDIAEDTERASAVIKNLRRMMKKEEGEFLPLAINEVAHEVVSLVKRDPVGHRVDISLQLEDDLPPVLGDRVQLQQVLMNLIRNGFEAMMYQEEGTRELVLRSRRQDERHLRVEVQDAGIGIEEAKLDRIFDPFFTTKSEGMGMGLSVNRTIIEAHGGRLWAWNNPEYGMTFSFTLPISEGEKA